MRVRTRRVNGNTREPKEAEVKNVLMFAVFAFVPLVASANGDPVPVPEPSALSLMLVGVAVIGAIKLRNKFRK